MTDRPTLLEEAMCLAIVALIWASVVVVFGFRFNWPESYAGAASGHVIARLGMRWAPFLIWGRR